MGSGRRCSQRSQWGQRIWTVRVLGKTQNLDLPAKALEDCQQGSGLTSSVLEEVTLVGTWKTD